MSLLQKMSLKTFGLTGAMVGWYASGKTDIERIRSCAYQSGLSVSQKLSILPGWESCMEPLVISQFARTFVCMHSFVQGLTSDNTNLVDIEYAKKQAAKIVLDEFSHQNETHTTPTNMVYCPVLVTGWYLMPGPPSKR